MRALAALLFVLATTSYATAADSLLPWAEFTPGATAAPASWKYNSAKFISVLDEGGKSMVRLTANEGSLVLAIHDRPLPAGTTSLTLAGSIRSENLVGGELPSQVGRIAVQVFAGDKRIGEQVQTVSGTREWQPIAITLACPAGADRFQVHFGSLKAKSGEVFVSGLELTAK